MTTDKNKSYPIAADPVMTNVITTDAAGLTSGEIKIPVHDGEIPAYQAHPSSGTSHPVVLVVHEIFGVHEHIKDICRRLAKLGYLAIAPYLLSRQGDVQGMTDMSEIVSKVVSKAPDEQIMADLDATLEWAVKTGAGNKMKTAITGFCWGGRITWLYCNHNPSLKAGVAWYGRLEGNRNELQPKFPMDIVGQLKVPVLGLYGGSDQSISMDSIERMRKSLGKTPSEIVVYPEAGHAFFADYRPTYRKEAAEDGWNRLIAWFETHGVSS